MTAALLFAAAVVVIVAVQGWARRTGVAAPLLLVAIGVAVSFLPFVPAFTIEPEWVLAGVLPPLLYSSAVSMPTLDFRRDFGSISSLSVLLVVVTSVVLGFVFHGLLGVDLAVGTTFTLNLRMLFLPPLAMAAHDREVDLTDGDDDARTPVDTLALLESVRRGQADQH